MGRYIQFVVALALLWVSHAQGSIIYVNANSTGATSPYTNWANAATTIQDAINVAQTGDFILVTNGVYPGGITTSNPVTIQSVNGSGATTIDANHTNRCANLSDGVSLAGFTLINGNAFNAGGAYCSSTNVFISNCLIVSNVSTGNYSGGVLYGTLSNCLIASNVCRTINGAGNGGGAAFSVLNNCVISNNLSGQGGGVISCTLTKCIVRANRGTQGGGADACTLDNCLVANNRAIYDASIGSQPSGGGTFGGTATNCTIVGNVSELYPNFGNNGIGGGCYVGTLNNCIIYSNIFGASAVNNCYNGTQNNCCTTPLPASGANNFTNAPLLVNLAGGDFHLQATSPCINSGKNSFVTIATDLDGSPRIVAGTVDVGAYEHQSPKSILSYAWAQQYGLHTDGTADFIDSDGTGMNNWQKWIAGLNPTNPASVLAMLTPVVTNHAAGVTVKWQSVNNRTYYLQRSSDLKLPSGFSIIQSNLAGLAGTTAYIDATATNAGPYFYRIGVQ